MCFIILFSLIDILVDIFWIQKKLDIYMKNYFAFIIHLQRVEFTKIPFCNLFTP